MILLAADESQAKSKLPNYNNGDDGMMNLVLHSKVRHFDEPDTNVWHPVKKEHRTYWLTSDSSLIVTGDEEELFVFFSKKIIRTSSDACTCIEDVGVLLDGETVTITSEVVIAEFVFDGIKIPFKVDVSLKTFTIPERARTLLNQLPFKHPLIKRIQGILESTEERRMNKDEI